MVYNLQSYAFTCIFLHSTVHTLGMYLSRIMNYAVVLEEIMECDIFSRLYE